MIIHLHFQFCVTVINQRCSFIVRPIIRENHERLNICNIKEK